MLWLLLSVGWLLLVVVLGTASIADADVDSGEMAADAKAGAWDPIGGGTGGTAAAGRGTADASGAAFEEADNAARARASTGGGDEETGWP